MQTTIGRALIGCLVFAIGLPACSAHHAPGASGGSKAAPRATALAALQGKSGSAMTGAASFEVVGSTVKLHVVLKNATPGLHAVHIHEKGDCSDPEGKSAGAHWNPTGAAHGHLTEPPCHLGDIGNVQVNDHGEGELTMSTGLWTIGQDPASDIVGKAVVVHAQVDDFKSQPAGNAGARVACGVIERGK